MVQIQKEEEILKHAASVCTTLSDLANTK